MTSVALLNTESAVTVIVLEPLLSEMAEDVQDVVPVQVPDEPRSLDQVTDVVPAEALPPNVIDCELDE